MRALRPLLGILLIAACAPATRAGLDPELDQPYRLQVVLYMSDNRVLTDVFRDKVQQDLRDSLQAALGKLARVEVVSVQPRDLEAKLPKPGARAHLDAGLIEHLRKIQANGLQRELDGWNFITDIKQHFLLID